MTTIPAFSATGSTSSTLVEQVKAQQPAAWQRFVQLYTPLVYYWCRSAGLQSPDAADVLQEVFQAIARNIGSFRKDPQGGGFRGWLWTIARNKLNDHFRRRSGQTEGLGGATGQDVLADVPWPALDESEPASDPLFDRALELIRAEFEPRTWDAFWRTVVEEQATEQVAADLGLSVNAVYKAKSRILARLRQELADWLDTRPK
jgi:RNA polymerase sigma-70 factor (ECF subfamily)